MITVEQACKLALQLPQASERDHHGRRSFRVANRIFATLWDEHHMNVMLDEPEIHTAVQALPHACRELYWGSRLRAVSVSLGQITPSELSELLQDAWEHKAPKTVIRGDRLT
jgi:hypothetical protein